MNVVYSMATDDLVQQFKNLLEENNKQLEQNLQQDFQKQLAENNKQIRKEIKEEVDPLHERMDAQYKNLTGQINTVRLEMKESEKNILEQVKPLANLIVDHDEQIAALQKAVGLRPKH
jgi:gas vesicle protein